MKMNLHFLIVLCLAIGMAGCEFLDTRTDLNLTQEDIDSDYSKLRNLGYAPYTFLRNGFSVLDGNIAAVISDEAEQTASSSTSQFFNNGSWNAYYNPLNIYSSNYMGIRAANYFLEYSVDYKTKLAQNRDTLSDGGAKYREDVEDIEYMRAEAHILRAYFYFELITHYGGVPLVKETLETDDNLDLPRASYDEVIDFIVAEIDQYKDQLQPNWKARDVSRDGRFDLGAALALKTRALLYAASPLHNEGNLSAKWEAAAAAANEIITLNRYSLHNSYRDLFLETNSATSSEVIWAIRCGSSNGPERLNYPIGSEGGNSGVTPSHNLVADYEYLGTPDPKDPYANRDPRLAASVVTNGSSWTGRTVEIWPGGRDARTNVNASRTGYYLKKFLNDEMDLVHGATKIHNWIVFRYAEILLNYAEAMNEAYGPDNNHGYSLTARDAINLVRSRQGVGLPPVVAANANEMREKIKYERRIELAFEDHRYWDLIRWKDAETILNQPLLGIKATKTTENIVAYEDFNVETRKFIAPKMYYFPIPNSEILKSNGILLQNPGWE
ncbi:MAG: RagB/SusD family nutrient uptake outer membrane protein [Dysgonamonadaceae bacterium]|nr:RagB/SusD family nutrient uptake outer membrane protein [Dysgonamonadaceae bacterium]